VAILRPAPNELDVAYSAGIMAVGHRIAGSTYNGRLGLFEVW
jgi:hypothetical protein